MPILSEERRMAVQRDRIGDVPVLLGRIEGSSVGRVDAQEFSIRTGSPAAADL